MIEVIFYSLFLSILDNFTNLMSVKNCFLKMPEYAGLFRKMPVNASGMDFTHKCRHFPNPAVWSLANLCSHHSILDDPQHLQHFVLLAYHNTLVGLSQPL